jgi:hypothetical protein
MPRVEVVVEGYARAPIDRAFAVIVPLDLRTVFTGFGPIPAVVGHHGQTGAWDHVGARRVVELADGSEAPEELTAYEPPRHFAYRVGPLGGSLRLLASGADGEWWFADAGPRGTHVRWSYTFALGGPAWPLARVVVPLAWRAYARRVLARTLAQAAAAA